MSSHPITSHRSVLGLPMLQPRSHAAQAWHLLMLAMDAVWVALYIPVSTAFCHHTSQPPPPIPACSWAQLVLGAR